jgi:hypothetical protein
MAEFKRLAFRSTNSIEALPLFYQRLRQSKPGEPMWHDPK